MTNNSIYSRVTCDCAAGPWHKIDYEKPETLPHGGGQVACYQNDTGELLIDFWDYLIHGINGNGFWYSGIRWTHWAEIRLPGEGK